ncbi:anosmin-1-like isoform X2 [Stylophora pistillata]|uniref:anosmin-1-like isoform X2 n=1 Tax=Stylophora pistillata TaxID=50429 RepID=UPI000C04D16C|nr:anosmin-1-like isoform X2 [Stylophora pistillata]
MNYYVTIVIGFIVCLQQKKSLAAVLSARCRSRCLAKEVETHLNITWISECVTEDCSACMKPCEQRRKKEKLSCVSICGPPVVPVKNGNACRESCRFLKWMHTEGDNSSCPIASTKSQCVLMQPENVEVEVSSNDHSQNFSIKWNGSWPTATVFIVSTRKQTKGKQLDKDVSHDWEELIQTSHTSVEVQPVPLLWHQYKVLAVTQYGSSSFSIPSKLIFAKPLRPQPPRNFHVVSMYIIKDLVQVEVSWKKPLNTIALPIHRYRLQWSLRPDIHLDEFISLQVRDKRLKGTIHKFTISNLQPNRTYVLELQAICRYENRRLRSKQVTVRIQTPTVAEVMETKKVKKTEIKRNKINNFLKKVTSRLPDRPITVTSMPGISSAKLSSTLQSLAMNSTFKS